MYLGKKLETNLEKVNGDEISAWMAHFIAEKMAAIGPARGKAKVSAQRECFEVILTLWGYQGYFPHDIRPFKEFDPIFRAMAHIDPNKNSPSFFRNENGDHQPPKEIKQSVEFISNLDAAARIIISFFVRESILHATNEATLGWLDAINGLAQSDEARIILKLAPELDAKEKAQEQNEQRKNELSEQIDRLEVFESLSREIKSVLKAELRKFDAEL